MIERPRWAWEELQPGDVIQLGDEWQNDDGRWHPLVIVPGASTQARDSLRARRPYNIAALQSERDEAQAAVKSAQRARDELQLQVDELRADRDKLQGLIDDLTDEPTAREVQDMLRRWATELDWSAGCFGSFGRSQIDIIQQTMIAVIQRIGSMIDPEATSADA